MHIPDYSSISPEISRLINDGAFSVSTLSELGFKRSAEAVAAGYVAVRPYVDGIKRPGLWLLAERLPAYVAAAENILAAKKEKRAKIEAARAAKKAEVIVKREMFLVKMDAILVRHGVVDPSFAALVKKNIADLYPMTLKGADDFVAAMVAADAAEKRAAAEKAARLAETEEDRGRLLAKIDAINDLVADSGILFSESGWASKDIFLSVHHFDLGRFSQRVFFPRHQISSIGLYALVDFMGNAVNTSCEKAVSSIHSFVNAIPEQMRQARVLRAMAKAFFKDQAGFNLKAFCLSSQDYNIVALDILNERLSGVVKLSLNSVAVFDSNAGGLKNNKETSQKVPYSFQFTACHPEFPFVQATHIGKLRPLYKALLAGDFDFLERTVREAHAAKSRELAVIVDDVRDAVVSGLGDAWWAENEVTKLLGVVLKKHRTTDEATKSFITKQVAELHNVYASQVVWKELADKWGDQRISHMYPAARALKRKLKVFAGPTNSGKTYSAFEIMKKARSGAYLAPLRLLALEGQEKLIELGLNASLVTGEERDIRHGSRFVASTIGMCSFDREIDVAIIDEAQMLDDSQRGWAWLSAIMGVPARTVVMTCSLDAVPALKSLAAYLEEEIEVVRLDRFNSLDIDKKQEKLQALPRGSALIAFSRRDVLDYKTALENAGKSVSVIYGALGPEVRREQARKFREGETDILVSTDAIAMGLNLPIKKVVFSTIVKWNGRTEEQLPPSLVRQIAGRAGRYGIHEQGFVGSLNGNALQYIRSALNGGAKDLTAKFSVMPTVEIIEMISEHIKIYSLSDALVFFSRYFVGGELFKVADLEEAMMLARFVDRHKSLSLKERFTFACAPVNTKVNRVLGFWQTASGQVAACKPVLLPVDEPTGKPPSSHQDLQDAEEKVQVVSLYRWLAHRFPELFTEAERAAVVFSAWNDHINSALKQSVRRKCMQCGKNLPLMVHHKMCDSCFRESRRDRWQGDWY